MLLLQNGINKVLCNVREEQTAFDHFGSLDCWGAGVTEEVMCKLGLREWAEGQQSVVQVGVRSETGWKEVRLHACRALKDRMRNLCAILMCDGCPLGFQSKE